VILLRSQKSTRLYIPAHLRHQMGDPIHIDLYVSPEANQVLIQPVSQKGPTTRKLSCGSIRLPTRIWGSAVRKIMGEKKNVCVSHQLDSGNLRVDLRHALGVEKQHRRGPKSAR